MSARSSNNQDGVPGPADFDSLVDLYYGPLFRFAMSLTHAEQDAYDLVQETFVTWGAKGHQLQDASRSRSWLFTTLHRAFLQRHRRSQRFVQVELTETALDLPSVEPETLSVLDGKAVLDLLKQIDPQFRAPVALFYLEDYSYLEIAAILDVPLGTVKSRIARGIAQLKLLLAERPLERNSP